MTQWWLWLVLGYCNFGHYLLLSIRFNFHSPPSPQPKRASYAHAQTTTPDWRLQEEAHVNAKEITTFHMEIEHDMSNILTSDNMPTTEMQAMR